MPEQVAVGLFLFLVFMMGACIGSFCNVIAMRVPLKESFTKGRSHCPKCKHDLSALDLIPFFSWIFLRGKCRYCKEKISFRYPLTELIGGLAALFSVWQLGVTINALVLFYLIMVLVTLSMIDLETMEIPDGFHIAILVAAILSYWFDPTMGLMSPTIVSRVIGFFVVSVPMYLLALLTGGFGGGDIKLMAVVGLLLGWKATLCAFMVGILSAAFYCIYILIYAVVAVARKEADSFKDGMHSAMKRQFAFGPYLSVGIVVAYLYSTQLISFYWGMFLK
jgi:leader peptidase (prepilin peptidase)/N-methyltransferase